METRIPTDILRKTDDGVTCFEIESLRFPITDVTQYVLFDAEEIKQRQSVFRDIITHPELLEKYDALRQKVDDLSEFYRKSGDDRDNESIVYSIIKIQLFTDIIDYVSEVLYPLCEDKTIKSQSMIDLTLACVKISREKTYGNVKKLALQYRFQPERDKVNYDRRESGRTAECQRDWSSLVQYQSVCGWRSCQHPVPR